MREMIKAENVTKTFEGFKALDGLNINVPKGSYTFWSVRTGPENRR
jgi:ABC-type multidrug transport system ATPase subunit